MRGDGVGVVGQPADVELGLRRTVFLEVEVGAAEADQPDGAAEIVGSAVAVVRRIERQLVEVRAVGAPEEVIEGTDWLRITKPAIEDTERVVGAVEQRRDAGQCHSGSAVATGVERSERKMQDLTAVAADVVITGTANTEAAKVGVEVTPDIDGIGAVLRRRSDPHGAFGVGAKGFRVLLDVATAAAGVRAGRASDAESTGRYLLVGRVDGTRSFERAVIACAAPIEELDGIGVGIANERSRTKGRRQQ